MGISFFLTETLKHVAATVAGVKLSDHVVELVFTLFDENGEICVHQIIMYYCRSQEIYVYRDTLHSKCSKMNYLSTCSSNLHDH